MAQLIMPMINRSMGSTGAHVLARFSTCQSFRNNLLPGIPMAPEPCADWDPVVQNPEMICPCKQHLLPGGWDQQPSCCSLTGVINGVVCAHACPRQISDDT